ncbi:Lipoprotein-releasing system ATP-binding protein LolD [Polystyrenella longa]|uniref:Lipoprotein-releasing system ATP-binding protein LolD n=1 Tax=Polystyrenella longa TaxID=2528007 RepID=A0A518CP83_9PLAN|nr:ABC transporter ATP-binding protein [Polystyrenella longa]QDU81037.1 Lipoprotein-releasing system ATP-binding protein LolD [Polystyrenella longa]
MATADLSIQDVSKVYQTVEGTLTILNEVNLELKRGEALAITGPSGSGKSTLLYIIGTLENPTTGTVQLNGQNPFELKPAEQAMFRNHEIGFIFQDHHLLPQCSVLENVLIPTLVDKGATKEKTELAKSLLDRVDLTKRIEHRPAQLSGGERQRVAVCRALINNPTVLLADEPTGNLDPRTAEAIGSLLLEIGKEQNTILVCVTHSETLAERFEFRQELSDGKLNVLATGSASVYSEGTKA